MPSRSPKARQKDSPPPRRRSRTRSPRQDSDARRRSRSPPRGPRQKNFSGLKWKKQDKREDDRDDRRGGYRDRGDDRRRDDRGRGYSGRDDDRDRRFDQRDRNRDLDRRFDRDGRDDRRGGRFDSDRPPRDDREKEKEKEKKPKAEKAKPTAMPSGPSEPMIIVTVNDRLGTKAQIPCLASDPIKVFKAMVAARIGRAPHEIMLKRQGERPMKDALTLEDYGVSHGVQLDLELDTGD